MSDFSDDIYENNKFRKKGLALSEEFALLEGRRPRILVAGTTDILTGSMNRICNTFADMGFDVDIAPKLKNLKKLASQSLENDADMILICSENCISFTELLDFQSCVLPDQPDMMMSLYLRDSNCKSSLEGHLKQWSIFDDKASASLMGYNLLSQLLSHS